MDKFMEFYNHVNNDENAKKELDALETKLQAEQHTDDDAVLEQLIAFAKKENFCFDKDELKDFFENMAAPGELSEDELDAVAGGKKRVCGGCIILGNGGNKTCCIAGENTSDDSDGFCFGAGLHVTK